MCGIAGIIQQTPTFSRIDQVKKMTDTLIHRGPDGEGFWQNESGTAFLGHRRLCIIDLSQAAAQPMHFPVTNPGTSAVKPQYTIIHNGEIYNYIELREELKKEGYSFTTASDTEVILAAYDFYGDECVEHFDGMFAFAIWDEEACELFAARDRFGEKPFLYSFNGNALVFASEMKALWAAGIEKKPNLQMLFNFITIGYADNPGNPGETFFEKVSRLPPASRLFYAPATNELTIEKYWDIDPSVQDKSITDEEALEKFNNLFATSVKRRLRSDVSLGMSLSGGLDSSSIVAMAASFNSQNKPLTAFTAHFPGFDKDESVFATQVASQFNLQHELVEISVHDLVNDWETFLYHQEEPFGSASAYAQYKVFEKAKQSGVTVLLDGQGADETLAGYSKYYKWFWQELFQKRKLFKTHEIDAARELGVQEKFTFKNVVAALVPDIASVILERQYLLNALRHEDLSRDFVRLQSKEAYYSAPVNFNLNGVLYFNTMIHGLEELLRYADRNAMAHGREVRLPFLSHELVEFVFSLPANFKIRNGWTKWILRQVINEKLPREITWKTNKIGFEPPQKSWMEDSRMEEMIMVARKKLVAEKILNPSVLDKKIIPSSAHDGNAYDWRYLAAAAFL